ncbi:hypothetical protein IT398_00950 [Candidatus Nomurabacteria bacterium]|nr:hypothetical protein [Candidatus Nomurabacteria bacterium]
MVETTERRIFFTGRTVLMDIDLSKPMSRCLRESPFSDVDARITDEMFPCRGGGGCKSLLGIVRVEQLLDCEHATSLIGMTGLELAFPEELVAFCGKGDERENLSDFPMVTLGRGEWNTGRRVFIYARLSDRTFRLGTFSGSLTKGTTILVALSRSWY